MTQQWIELQVNRKISTDCPEVSLANTGEQPHNLNVIVMWSIFDISVSRDVTCASLREETWDVAVMHQQRR